MKIKDLKSINNKLYRNILRSRIWWYKDCFNIYGNQGEKSITEKEIDNFEIKDIFDLFDDQTVLRNTRGLGISGLMQLKELA